SGRAAREGERPAAGAGRGPRGHGRGCGGAPRRPGDRGRAEAARRGGAGARRPPHRHGPGRPLAGRRGRDRPGPRRLRGRVVPGVLRAPGAGGPVTDRVVLVGFMAVGKTTLGRALAAQLGWDFVDLDDEIEAAAGRTIAELFRDEGEAAFRAREEAA